MNVRMDRQDREHFAEPPQIEASAKAKRLAKGGKNSGPGPKGRGFDNRFKRKINGRVERREEVR